MPAERYFIDTDLEADTTLQLEGKELHHLAHVMRTRVGECVELVNGRGSLAEARVIALSKRSAELEIYTTKKSSPPQFALALAQAIPRPNRLDMIVEKGTELGMTHLYLFPTKRSERGKLMPSAQERVRGQAIAAMKQCGRLYLPEIHYCGRFEEALELSYPGFFGDVEPEAPRLAEAWHRDQVNTGREGSKEVAREQGVLFFVGPESGFSEGEVEALRAQFCGVRLHRNILRTDTASLVALSLLSDLIDS